MASYVPRAFEDFQAFEVDKTVDILKPLTVNSLLVRLVNTLASSANGTESRR